MPITVSINTLKYIVNTLKYTINAFKYIINIIKYTINTLKYIQIHLDPIKYTYLPSIYH
jgi:hypothetical protein